MEKRLVTFLILSVLIITGHVLIRSMFFPPARNVAQQDDQIDPGDAPGQADQDPSKKAAAPGEEPAAEGSEEADGSQVAAERDPADGSAAAPPAPEAPVVPAAPAEPETWATLGSFAPNSGNHLLVTLNNRGASVERVELVERDSKGRLRYRDLIRTYGYLGLHTRHSKEGCIVKVVGPGTPADLATSSGPNAQTGFKVGDQILSTGGVSIGSEAELDAVLAETKAGETITFDVQRDDATIQLTAELDHWPLQLIQPETPVPSGLELGTAGNTLLVPPETTQDDPMISSCLLGIHSVGASIRSRDQDELSGITSLRHSTWTMTQLNEQEIIFSQRVQLSGQAGDSELEFRRRYKLNRPADGDADKAEGETASANPYAAYHLQMDVEIENLGASPQTVSYVLDGPNGLPMEGWWYTNKIHPSWGSAGARDVVWRIQGAKHSLRSATQIYKQSKEAAEENDPAAAITSILTDNPAPAERTFDYLGVDTQYFSAVLLSGTMAAREAFICQQAYSMPLGEMETLSGRGMKKLNTSYRMVSVATPIEPGQSIANQYQMFLGPKSSEVLEAYNIPDMIEYGWFGKIAKPLSWLLHTFYSFFRNYGLAIIVLTVLVRGAMFPIGRKAARNAQIMQELAPEIKKIKEKYKNDLEKQGQAQRELWKHHNFNPLSGCWLMFLQLPIFIGLYRCLSVDINLRQAPLIPGLQWCSNLAGPDMAWRWQGILPDFFAAETGWLGPYLNILPIITIILFIAQQKMFTPPATDEQTQMQQKMMKYMMIFMGVMFFKVPAGLCVYFIASSLWGIGERKLLPKPNVNATAPGTVSAGRSKAAPEKKGWLQRLRDKAEVDAAEVARQRRKRRK